MNRIRILAFSIVGVTVLVITAFMAGAFTENDATEQQWDSDRPAKFQVISPVMLDTSYSVEYVADIEAVQHIELRVRAEGYIVRIHADEGQFVKQGDVLFSINSQEYETELLMATAMLNNAAAELKAAEIEWKNTRELVDKNIVSASQLELAQAKIDALTAKVEEAGSQQSAARLNLSYTQVKAPFNGIIGRIYNKTGSLVGEGDLLTTISDNSRIYAYFNVSEKEYLDLMSAKNNTIQQSVSFVMANLQPYPYRGKIETVDSRVNKETGNIAFRASFSNPKLLLKHGSTGKVRIEREIKNALIIPQIATVEAQDIMYVYTVDESNTVGRKNIVPKLRLPHLYVIESGVTNEDMIVYKGLQLIREGDMIETEVIPFLSRKSNDHQVLINNNTHTE